MDLSTWNMQSLHLFSVCWRCQHLVFFSVIILIRLYMQIFPDTIVYALAHIGTGLAKFFSVHHGHPLAGSCTVCFPGVHLRFSASAAFSNGQRFHDNPPLSVFLSPIYKISSKRCIVKGQVSHSYLLRAAVRSKAIIGRILLGGKEPPYSIDGCRMDHLKFKYNKFLFKMRKSKTFCKTGTQRYRSLKMAGLPF